MSKDLSGEPVLVVGAGSFLGASLVRALVRRGATTHAAVRPGSHPQRLADVARDVEVHSLDVRDGAAALRVLDTARPTHVVNLARHRSEDSAADRARMMQTNVIGTSSLLEAAIAVGCRRFVQIGSPMEYGPSNHPLDEADPPAPRTLFGATKAASTLLCVATARSGRLATCVLRPFMVYGPRDKPGRLVPTAIRAALTGSPLPLTHAGLRRDWVFVEDVVAAFLLALGGGADGEVVNVGTGVQWENQEVVGMIEAATGQEIDVRPRPMEPRPWDSRSLLASTQKARALLGFEARATLAEGIRRTVAWTREQPSPAVAGPPPIETMR
jgi:UDP-glucose 4-epimerase